MTIKKQPFSPTVVSTMHHSYHPTAQEQRGGLCQVRLCIGHGELRWEEARGCHVDVMARARSRGWLARIDGVSAQWSLKRTFLQGHGGVAEGATRYALDHGLYEAECMLEPPCVEQEGVYRVYIEYDELQGLRVLTRAQFEDRVRASCQVSFGDVRALVAQQRWHEAERVCEFIGDAPERVQAMDYVAQQQERWTQTLPDLEGAPREIERALALRQNGLTALRDFAARFASGQGPAKEELEHARRWLLAQRAASFWTEHLDRLDGERLWEIYLEQHVET